MVGRDFFGDDGSGNEDEDGVDDDRGGFDIDGGCDNDDSNGNNGDYDGIGSDDDNVSKSNSRYLPLRLRGGADFDSNSTQSEAELSGENYSKLNPHPQLPQIVYNKDFFVNLLF